MISVLILTYNEEQDLPACLDSVAFSDDIHVFDSNSTDKTQQIAQNRGAHHHTRAFDNYAAQRNAAMQLPFRHPWVLVLDADERGGPARRAGSAQNRPPTPPTSSQKSPKSSPKPRKPPPPTASAAATSSGGPGSPTRNYPLITSASSASAASNTPAKSTK